MNLHLVWLCRDYRFTMKNDVQSFWMNITKDNFLIITFFPRAKRKKVIQSALSSTICILLVWIINKPVAQITKSSLKNSLRGEKITLIVIHRYNCEDIKMFEHDEMNGHVTHIWCYFRCKRTYPCDLFRQILSHRPRPHYLPLHLTHTSIKVQ